MLRTAVKLIFLLTFLISAACSSTGILGGGATQADQDKLQSQVQVLGKQIGDISGADPTKVAGWTGLAGSALGLIGLLTAQKKQQQAALIGDQDHDANVAKLHELEKQLAVMQALASTAPPKSA